MDLSDRRRIEARQLRRLRRLIAELLPGEDGHNPFWSERLRAAGLDATVASLADFRRLPPLAKDELVDDQRRHPPYGTNLTYPLERYVRLCQTSGTSGRPLFWLDTAEGWEGMLDAWGAVFAAAGLRPGDSVFFPFSFGPFLGFWTAFDAAWRQGYRALAGGGLSSRQRLAALVEHAADAVCCTPTYALRLAEVAAADDIDLAASPVRVLVVAGEPGGSVPAVRERLARLWGAAVCDHHGMTEVGPMTFENADHPGQLHILEDSYLAEIVDPENGSPTPRGEVGELVVTTLRRPGSPLMRYRTGDLVRRSARPPEELGRAELALDGGILARADDMVVVRGVNLYPSAVDAVVRGLPGIAEYRVELRHDAALAEIEVAVEPEPRVTDPETLAARLAAALRDAFQLRIPVRLVAAGTLPRFELKARRWRRLDDPPSG